MGIKTVCKEYLITSIGKLLHIKSKFSKKKNVIPHLSDVLLNLFKFINLINNYFAYFLEQFLVTRETLSILISLIIHAFFSIL